MSSRAEHLAAAVLCVGLSAWGAAAQAPAQPTSRNPHGTLAGDCSTCHTAEGWAPLRKPLVFDHQGTGFPLDAAHAQASCRDCHVSLVFSQVGTACADCHRDAHDGELGTQCGSCHMPESCASRWQSAQAVPTCENTSETWQSRHDACACAASSGKPVP